MRACYPNKAKPFYAKYVNMPKGFFNIVDSHFFRNKNQVCLIILFLFYFYSSHQFCTKKTVYSFLLRKWEPVTSFIPTPLTQTTKVLKKHFLKVLKKHFLKVLKKHFLKVLKKHFFLFLLFLQKYDSKRVDLCNFYLNKLSSHQ